MGWGGGPLGKKPAHFGTHVLLAFEELIYCCAGKNDSLGRKKKR